MFEKLDSIEDAPFDLLLLADPSMKLILEYLQSGECFIYKDGSVILGCYVLKEINIDKVELVNIAVSENKQSHGIGKNYYYICLIMQNKKDTKRSLWGQAILVLIKLLLSKAGFRMIGVEIGFFERNYNDKIYENGILCRDKIWFWKSVSK